MNSHKPPIVSDLVLIGGGHAHVHVLKMLGMPKYRNWLWQEGIQVTLIAKDIHTPYSGMLPGFVSGHYSYNQIHLDLQQICKFSNIRLIHAACTKIITTTNNHNNDDSFSGGGGGGFICCNDGRPPLRYDALSLDIGSAPGATDPSIYNHPRIIPVKPIANFCQFYQRLQDQFEKAQTVAAAAAAAPEDGATPKRIIHRVCIVGGGAGGVELTLSVQHNLQQLLLLSSKSKSESESATTTELQMVLVTRGTTLLAEHNESVQRIFTRILKERNIELHLGAEVIGVHGKKNQLLLKAEDASGHNNIPFDDCLWCTSAAGASWLSQETPFECNSSGFVKVDDAYQVLKHPGVFAVGDCCHMVNHPRSKAGVFAVRAGPPLLENLKRHLQQTPLQPYIPQSNFLGILSTGDQYAVASNGPLFCVEGSWVWKWKDYIDRAWMAKYTTDMPDLQEMMKTFEPPKQAAAAVSLKGASVLTAFQSDPMRCGGCGAKVGSTSLSRVLKALHQHQIKRALERNLPPPPPIDHDDAAITLLPASLSGGGGAMIHTIDYFRSLMDDPYMFGKIVAVHALSDVHAMVGATAQSALSLAVVPFAADEGITESNLLQLLAGVGDVLQDEGVQMIGGHTCEGTELACGLAVQGYTAHPDKVLRKRGGRIGDKIVLTKPLGTGALFAADMRAKCKGEYVFEAVQSMIQSNVSASRVASLESHGVRACTDVTGFGMMGHLIEMLLANDEDTKVVQDLQLPCIGAAIQIEQVPFLRGGLEASSQGIFSSLQPQNIRNRRAVKNHSEASQKYSVTYPLLFDPQTAGGLMMFVDPDRCGALLKGLEAAGVAGSAVIGEIVEQVVESSDTQAGEEGFLCTVGGQNTNKRITIV